VRTQEYATVLTPEELALFLRLGRTSVYKLLSAGEVKSFRVGRRRLIRREDAEAYIHQRIEAEN
jgi:excisionase family DNA binding protein